MLTQCMLVICVYVCKLLIILEVAHTVNKVEMQGDIKSNFLASQGIRECTSIRRHFSRIGVQLDWSNNFYSLAGTDAY